MPWLYTWGYINPVRSSRHLERAYARGLRAEASHVRPCAMTRWSKTLAIVAPISMNGFLLSLIEIII
jgi:hypothetical protein